MINGRNWFRSTALLTMVLAATGGCQDTTGLDSARVTPAVRPAARPSDSAASLPVTEARYFTNMLRQDSDTVEGKPDEFSPLFEGWEKPELVLFVSGRQHGYIEPCGCAGLDQMKGGLLRRHAVLNQMVDAGWPVLRLDMGDQVHRIGSQAQLKLESTYNALRGVMNYDAIGMGPGELALDPFPVYSILLNTSPGEEVPSPFVSANAAIYADRDQIPTYKVIERNGYKVGVTSVISLDFFKGIKNLDDPENDLVVTDPVKSLEEVVPQMVEEKCDVNILLAYVPEEESRELAKRFPQFNFVVNEGVEGEPEGTLDYLKVGERNVGIMQMGYKSMFAGAIAIYADKDQPVRYQKIPLDHRFQDTEEMKAIFKSYQNALKKKGLLELAGPPVEHPSGNQYVGSATCAECHEDEYDIWKNGTKKWQDEHPGEPGPHARATADLVEPGERTWVTRQYDPECLSCHVTGWNPQQYFAYKTGYWDFEKDQHLHGSGCENCHGPASRHVAIENGELELDEEQTRKVLNDLYVDIDQAQQNLCATCHDLNNSPQFDFDTYWPMIEH